MSHDVTALRYAVLAADYRSFARAASVMRVKQATLSRRISTLEYRIGIKLFERSTRGAIPTSIGRDFIDSARAILTDLDGLIDSGRLAGAGQIGTLGLGFSTSLASGHMRAVIVDFLEHNPHVRIAAVEGDRSRLAHALHRRSIDFAVLTGDIPKTGLQKRTLWSERVMVALPDTHELAERDRIYWTDMRGERFVLPRQDPGPDLVDLMSARLWEPGRRLPVETQDVTRENILNMVSVGRFLTLTTDAALGRTLPGVVLREVYEPSGHTYHIDYYGFWRSDSSNPILDRFMKRIEERYSG